MIKARTALKNLAGGKRLLHRDEKSDHFVAEIHGNYLGFLSVTPKLTSDGW
jgi:hypothetical protein